MRLRHATVSILAVFLLPTLALAESPDPDLDTGLGEDPLIWMGTTVGECGWPTTVAVTSGGGLCTGTLVHPQLVIYAAHCGAGNKTIRFNTSAWNGGNAVGTQFCQTNPEYSGEVNDETDDGAFCVLNQPVDLPITPPLYGCEMNELTLGVEAAIVGFGNNQGQSGSGTKRWGMVTIEAVNIPGNEVKHTGGDEPSICSGDSGGPAFIKLDDGVWHVFGITSTGPDDDCGVAGTYTHSIVAGHVPWIESASGIDITPCHDVDGSWNPGPDCGGFFGSGEQQYGTWNNWCSGTPESPLSTNCGPAYGEPSEDNPPDIAWVQPTGDVTLADGESIDFEVDASDDTYVNEVQLFVDDESIATDTSEPYLWEGAAFPVGSYQVYAYAEDYWGNSAVTETITIQVTEDGLPGDGDGDGDGAGNGDGDGDGAGDGDGDGDGGPFGTDDFSESGQDKGCGCAADDSSGGLALLVSAFALMNLRRRRRR
jgi:MYXO-CTERM domain-containing protein